MLKCVGPLDRLTNTSAINTKRISEKAGSGTAHYWVARAGAWTRACSHRRTVRNDRFRISQRSVRVGLFRIGRLGVGARAVAGIRLGVESTGDAQVSTVLIYTLHVTPTRVRQCPTFINVWKYMWEMMLTAVFEIQVLDEHINIMTATNRYTVWHGGHK